MRLVPFNDVWVSHPKLDLHAIYKRPRFAQGEYGESVRERTADNVPTWDITAPLPVRQHQRWLAKGFEYVTLATRTDLARAAQVGTVDGAPAAFLARNGHPWSWPDYVRQARAEQDGTLEELRRDVAKFGALAVETIRRRNDPNFRLPPDLEAR